MSDKINQNLSDIEEIKKLLQENLDYSKANHAILKKASNFITWQKVMAVLKILFIVVPIILGIIYLPPMIEQLLKSHEELLR